MLVRCSLLLENLLETGLPVVRFSAPPGSPTRLVLPVGNERLSAVLAFPVLDLAWPGLKGHDLLSDTP